MRTVYVLRHGKSDWSLDEGSDHDRPLAPRGVEAAKRMGRFLLALDQSPDLIASSTATRARTTADLAKEAGKWTCPITHHDCLYEASVATTLDLIRRQSETIRRLLLVGHQPTLSQLIAALSGGTAVRFPTAALARIDLDLDRWEEIGSNAGTLRWLVTPKLLLQVGVPF